MPTDSAQTCLRIKFLMNCVSDVSDKLGRLRYAEIVKNYEDFEEAASKKYSYVCLKIEKTVL